MIKYRIDHVRISLDCCGPRSANTKFLRQKIQEISSTFEPFDLSVEGSVLLGLLEKDFSSVTACTAKTIVSHIEEVGLLRLPRSVSGLYPILEQLQAIGSLLILGGKEKGCYLVLNVSQLTNEVHKRLFSEEAFSNEPNTLVSSLSPFYRRSCPHTLRRSASSNFSTAKKYHMWR